MSLLLLVAAAFGASPAPAHTPEEEAAKKATDAAYGSAVPWAAICFATVKVGDAAPAQVVGVRRRETGCEAFGVMVGGAFTKVDAALPVVVGADVYKALPAAKKDEVLKAWVDQVYVAFSVPRGAATVGHAGGKTQITREMDRRDGEAGKAADVRSVFHFDAAGLMVERQDTVLKLYTTALFVQQLAVSGLTDAVAQTGLESAGSRIRVCWQDAWEKDHTIDGFTRLQWTVGGGKASGVTEIDASTLPAGVVECLNAALQRSEWPAEAAGTAKFVIGLNRREKVPGGF